MFVLAVRNVCEALPRGVELLLKVGVEQPSRNGPVLVAPCPVMTEYERPQERVLVNAVRDANPFFHVVEPLWMIRGDRSALLLNNFVRDFGERFAEPGVQQILHGAYGHRWRRHFLDTTTAADEIDQLDWAVARLRRDPDDRQVVLSMWDPAVDANDEPLRDRPCNTQMYLRVRTETSGGSYSASDPDGTVRHMNLSQAVQVLDLTVTCRSNDIIWGAYGANAVHFSFIQEYLAARIGVQVGLLYQFSNNFHAYRGELDRLTSRMYTAFYPYRDLVHALRDGDTYAGHPPVVVPSRFVDDPAVIDREVEYLLGAYETLGEGPTDNAITNGVLQLRNRFLAETVWPMLMAHRAYKSGSAWDHWAACIASDDWRRASVEWLERRRK